MKKAAEDQKKASGGLNNLQACANNGIKDQNEGGAAGPSHLHGAVKGQKMQVEGTSSTCLIHNSSWANRLQYVLNQLQTEYHVPNNICKAFARAVCDCSNLRHLDIELPDFPKDAVGQALMVKNELMKWRGDQQIIKPLINLLVDGFKENMSLQKFVFYFIKVISNDYIDLQRFENRMQKALPKRKLTQLQQPRMVDASAEPSTDSRPTVPVTPHNAAVDNDTVPFGAEDPNPLDMVSGLDPTSLASTVLATEDKDHTVIAGTESVSSPTEVKKKVNEEKDVKTKPLSKEEPCAEKEMTKCFVHDSRWFSLYQYTLNQMHKRNMLPRNKGVKFSSFICTCMQSTQAQATDTNLDQNQLSTVIFDQSRRHVQIILEGWSKDEPKVFLPLFAAMEKLKQSDIYKSLVKFVFYFNELHNKNTEFLGPANQSSASGSSQLKPAGTELRQHTTGSSPTAIRSETHSSADQHSASYSAESSSVSSQQLSQPPSVNPDCMYHSRKWNNILQYMVNNLYNERLIDGRKKKEFFQKICSCDGQFDFSSIFKDRAEVKHCMTITKTAAGKWKRAPNTIEQLFKVFGEFEDGEDISSGILKFLYYFKKTIDGEFKCYT
ncbi:hypothetical protein CHS0354_024761 [Potamilus streckersoni]|uniref:Uncharacterized protein n=1 Tax=Potamilus streckersoni TaxID=2493646 RepID=A0AAE0VK41_9BIVA|nr:hypothetical protein CHS0354_024761 [Potamilus streckersoni]